MLQSPYYIYKTPDGFWCDIHVPQGTVNCSAECRDIRFDLKSLSSDRSSTIPEAFDNRFNLWEPRPTESISCVDNSKPKDETIEIPAQQPPSIPETQPSETIETKTQESIATSAPLTVESPIQPEVNQPTQQISPNVTAKESLRRKNLIPKHKISMEKLNKRPKSFLKNLKQIQIETSEQPQSEPADQPQPKNKKLPNMPKLASRVLTSQSQPDAPQPFTVSAAQKLKSCPAIEFQYFERNLLITRIQFSLLLGVQCKSYPVYRSPSGVYLFRNIYGDWCQDKMATFDIKTNCAQRCTQKRVLPTGIMSPLQSDRVEIISQIGPKITLSGQNHRYYCSASLNCESTPCLNNGICMRGTSKLNGNTEYFCACPSNFNGAYCDTIINQCLSNPCQSNATCVPTLYEGYRCQCPLGFVGANCETEKPSCRNITCQNGGKCVESDSKTFCECLPEFEGASCDTFKACTKEVEGKLFANPLDAKSFIICTNSGFALNECPPNLVYNSHLERCDYSAEKSTDKCEPSPCLNNAKCMVVDDEAVCACPVGFTGKNCETNVNECEAEGLCGVNGTCVDLANGWVCLCDGGFYGSDCDVNKTRVPCTEGFNQTLTFHSYPFDSSVIVKCNENGKLLLSKCAASLNWNPFTGACSYEAVNLNASSECQGFNCLHGGSCAVDVNKEPFCICQAGFEGKYCEKNIDDCASNPCMNNGTCVDGVNSYQCVCAGNIIDKDCCCVATANPCALSATNVTYRHSHPFTKEEYIVCNSQGFAHVLSCPQGLVWNQGEQTCVKKDGYIYDLFANMCTVADSGKFAYPYSKFKYISCESDGNYVIERCAKETPYFCEKKSECVASYDASCSSKKMTI